MIEPFGNGSTCPIPLTNPVSSIVIRMNITPGEILLEEYLKPMGISQNAMARAIGVEE